MNLEIVIATGNQGKMKEYRELFKNCPIVFYSLKDLNLNVDIDENGTTYEENALIKAKEIAKIVNFPVLADDSGIEVEALDNFPGLHSARFASSQGGNEKANLEIIKRLSDKSNKNATFKCVIALVVKDKHYIFKGEAKGRILDEPAGTNGFGYDPIFFSDEANMPLGIASDEIKNTVSHRAKASKKLKTLLLLKNYKLD